MKKQYLYAMAVLALAAVSGMAVAMRANEVELVYLDAKNNVVGGKTLFCNGGTSSWGKTTPVAKVVDSWPCN